MTKPKLSLVVQSDKRSWSEPGRVWPEPLRVLGLAGPLRGPPPSPNLLQVSTQVKRKFPRHGELIRVPPRTPLPPTLTFDRGAGAALPVVPQVHRTFFNLAKDFKAALQLGACAVGPQSAHVHDPSLLLLVKREDRHKSQRLKVEVCCFSSAGLNEQVLIAPLPSGDPFLSPPAVLSLIGSACFPLSDKVASRAPAVCLANAAPPSLPPPSSRLISRSDFYRAMSLSLGASAKNKSDAETQTDISNKSLFNLQTRPLPSPTTGIFVSCRGGEPRGSSATSEDAGVIAV